MVIHCGAGMSSKVTYMWLQDPHVEKSLVHHRAEEAESTNRLHRFPGKSLNLTELSKKHSLLIIVLLRKIILKCYINFNLSKIILYNNLIKLKISVN